MTARRRRLAAQVFAVAVALLIGAGDVWARGGGRGGGGGGGRGGGGGGGGRGGGGGSQMGKSSHRGGASSRQSVNKGGPASRGMGSAKRAQTRPSKPPGGQRAATQPGMNTGGRSGMGASTQPSRPGDSGSDRPGERTERQGTRQENRTERSGARGEQVTERQDNRQDFAKDVQDNRQDFWNDNIEDVDWNEVDWDDYEVHDDFEWGLGTWMALSVGTIITVGAWNTMTQQAGCNLEQTEVNGQQYMKCGNTWYIEAWSGDQVHYVAVEPPV